MLYSGKRPEEMTGDELEAAEAHVLEHMRLANAQYELNRIAYAELAAEQQRRFDNAKRVN